MSYVDEVIAKASEKNATEPEFLQTVEEVLSSLKPVVDKNEEKAEREPVVLKNIRNSPSLKLKYMGEVREGVNIIDVTEDEESLFYCYFRAEKPGFFSPSLEMMPVPPKRMRVVSIYSASMSESCQ